MKLYSRDENGKTVSTEPPDEELEELRLLENLQLGEVAFVDGRWAK